MGLYLSDRWRRSRSTASKNRVRSPMPALPQRVHGPLSPPTLRVLQSAGRVHRIVQEADWKRSEEDAVDIDPDDARRYLDGVDYPASKADLLTAAQANNAPESFLARLRDLPSGVRVLRARGGRGRAARPRGRGLGRAPDPGNSPTGAHPETYLIGVPNFWRGHLRGGA